MAKDKNAPRYDKQGARRVMRKRDYLSDFSGQLALGLMANIVGQLSYFYTDKVGLAVGSVGIILAISKVIDAFTDVIAGNMIDHSKGGDHKYFKWILPQIIPAAAIVVLMFTVPIQAGQIPGVIYALVTNLILSAGLYTFIATPFAAVMTVRTRSADLDPDDPGDKYAGRNTVRMDQIRRSAGSACTCPVRNMLPQRHEVKVRL